MKLIYEAGHRTGNVGETKCESMAIRGLLC